MWRYIHVLRIDHWFKNVFILPGIAFALLADPSGLHWGQAWSLSVAIIAACLAASSNYVLNEILDAPYDRLHPTKQMRALASGAVDPRIARLMWIGLGLVALLLGVAVNRYLGLSILLLLTAGFLYNTPPFRTKDQPVLDVISEAANNPIRLMIGWYATGCTLSPPLSLLLCYWALGAYLMAIKRLAEFRHLNDTQLAADYRASFRHYNEARLLVCIMFYATACGMCAGIFIARYHLELVLCVPPFALFMAAYLRIGLKPNSPAQHPERLLRSRSMIVASVALTAILCFSLWLDSPWLRHLFEPTINPQAIQDTHPHEESQLDGARVLQE